MLSSFFDEMYRAANAGVDAESKAKVTWTQIQDLAHRDDLRSLEKIVLETAQKTVRLPVIRTALKTRIFDGDNGTSWSVKEGDTVILDIVSRLYFGLVSLRYLGLLAEPGYRVHLSHL